VGSFFWDHVDWVKGRKSSTWKNVCHLSQRSSSRTTGGTKSRGQVTNPDLPRNSHWSGLLRNWWMLRVMCLKGGQWGRQQHQRVCVCNVFEGGAVRQTTTPVCLYVFILWKMTLGSLPSVVTTVCACGQRRWVVTSHCCSLCVLTCVGLIANLKGHYFQRSLSVCLCVSDRHFYPSLLTDFDKLGDKDPTLI